MCTHTLGSLRGSARVLPRVDRDVGDGVVDSQEAYRLFEEAWRVQEVDGEGAAVLYGAV